MPIGDHTIVPPGNGALLMALVLSGYEDYMSLNSHVSLYRISLM